MDIPGERSRRTTLIPSEGPAGLESIAQTVSSIATVVETITERLSADDKGRPRPPGVAAGVLSGVLASLVCSGVLWGLHENLGGRAEADRLQAIETEQQWSRWALEAIANSVGANLPPRPTDSR